MCSRVTQHRRFTEWTAKTFVSDLMTRSQTARHYFHQKVQSVLLVCTVSEHTTQSEGEPSAQYSIVNTIVFTERATVLLFGSNTATCSWMTTMHCKWGWTSLSIGRDRHWFLFVYKALTGRLPQYLSTLLKWRSSRHFPFLYFSYVRSTMSTYWIWKICF